jgi:hypothetical protein
MNKYFRITTLFCALFILSSASAFACSCLTAGTALDNFHSSENVAVFKLRSVQRTAEGEQTYGLYGLVSAKLTVEKVYKGKLKVGDELTFKQGGGGDCVRTFSDKFIGTDLLFYLGRKPGKGQMWSAGTCTRSNTVKGAAADILYFDNMKTNAGKTRISGTLIQKFEPAVEGDEWRHEPIAGLVVTIAGSGITKQLKTNADGVYEIYGLKPGKYRVTPEKVPGFRFSDENKEYEEVEIDVGGMDEADFRFEIHNAIRGRVFDSAGKPFQGACLDLLPARGAPPQYFRKDDCTDKDGSFAFDNIPSGTWIIVANKPGRITAASPFGKLYYPGTDKREEASEIPLGPGDFRDNLVFNILPAAETVTISGTVTYADGKPAPDLGVSFFDGGKPDEYASPDAITTTDRDGRFAIAILKGQKGDLIAWMYSYIGKFENCRKLDDLVRASGETNPRIDSAAIPVEANADQAGFDLKLPFNTCKKGR